MKLKPMWMPESIDRGVDKLAGARLTQLTSAASITHDIYCEERYTSADGSRIAMLRSPAGCPPEELWVCDLRTREVACLDTTILGYPSSNLYQDALYYIRAGNKSGRTLARLDMKALELEDVCDMSGCPPTKWPVASVSPDERYFVSNLRVSDNVWGFYRVDLKDGSWAMFHEHKDICNPHPQFEPSEGRDILVQLNRGCVLDDEENVIHLVGEEGATLYVIDRDGKNERPLPVGKPHTSDVTGHECWVGRTGKVILTTGPWPRDEIHLVAPGDKRSRLVWKGLCFSHISATSDGRHFVVDDVRSGLIYVGNIASARMLPICDTRSSCAAPQYTHPHPYMTPDNRHVIFNSDHSGLGQVWAAEVPAGFFEALDLE